MTHRMVQNRARPFQALLDERHHRMTNSVLVSAMMIWVPIAAYETAEWI